MNKVLMKGIRPSGPWDNSQSSEMGVCLAHTCSKNGEKTNAAGAERARGSGGARGRDESVRLSELKEEHDVTEVE